MPRTSLLLLLALGVSACGDDSAGTPSQPSGPTPTLAQVTGTYHLVSVSGQRLPYLNPISTGPIGRITAGSLSLVAHTADGGDAGLTFNEDLRDPLTGACCSGSTAESSQIGWTLSSAGALTLEGVQSVRTTYEGVPVTAITVNVQALDNTRPPGLFRFER
jgi:hypothetical protein